MSKIADLLEGMTLEQLSEARELARRVEAESSAALAHTTCVICCGCRPCQVTGFSCEMCSPPLLELTHAEKLARERVWRRVQRRLRADQLRAQRR